MKNIMKLLRESLIGKPVRLKADLPLPEDIQLLNDLFVKQGFELYVVGGAVRDFLLNKPVKDYDVVTNAVPDTVKEILSSGGIRNVGVGEQFGVVNAIINGEQYEIATFREDSASGDGRRPDSVSYSTIETDVKRRDLTINALFYDINKKEIVDYVGGIEDIRNGVVRTVGDPSKRFGEDSLRILRAVRFAARTGNGLDSEIDKYLRAGEYDLSSTSSERVRDEFIKSIQSAVSVKDLMGMYESYGLFKWIFPYFKINTNYIECSDEIIVIAQLLMGNEGRIDVSRGLNKINYTIQEIRGILFLIHFNSMINPLNAPTLKRKQVITSLSDEQIRESGRFNNVDQKLVDTFLKYELTVNGQEVMATYNIKGKDVGDKIEQLEIENFNKLYNHD